MPSETPCKERDLNKLIQNFFHIFYKIGEEERFLKLKHLTSEQFEATNTFLKR